MRISTIFVGEKIMNDRRLEYLSLIKSLRKSDLHSHAGIPVTINTDDMLIFNQSVSEEYVNLLCAGTLNIDEIEKIRLTGLGEIL